MICAACQGSGTCPRCRGLGATWCEACRGRGEVLPQADPETVRVRGFAPPVRCRECDGSGVQGCPTQCAACEGRGEVLAPLEQAVAELEREANAFPPATAILILLIFISFGFETVAHGYRYRFWLYGQQALHGQWWQFLTSLFLHTDLLELAFNSAALFFLGPPLERLVGTARFAVLYLASGLIGNLLSVVTNPYIQTVGASGCLFGVAGAWVGVQLRARPFPPRLVGMLLAYVVLTLGFGFATDSPVNNMAHLGGLLFGFLASLLMPVGETIHESPRISAGGGPL